MNILNIAIGCMYNFNYKSSQMIKSLQSSANIFNQYVTIQLTVHCPIYYKCPNVLSFFTKEMNLSELPSLALRRVFHDYFTLFKHPK